jgi:hypothetical protein
MIKTDEVDRDKLPEKLPGLIGNGALHSIVPIPGGSNGWVSTDSFLVVTEHPDE